MNQYPTTTTARRGRGPARAIVADLDADDFDAPEHFGGDTDAADWDDLESLGTAGDDARWGSAFRFEQAFDAVLRDADRRAHADAARALFA